MTDSRARILVVEDEPEIRRFIRMAIESDGHEGVEAENLKKARIELGLMAPDLIVLDLGLPDGDGVLLIRDVRSWSTSPSLCCQLVVASRTRSRPSMPAPTTTL